ncbi:MAG: type II methionyl aminopeptidase [Candidatus Woesearchaeota archaeon]
MEKEILNDYIKAGKIAAKALKYGKKLIQIDASLLDVCEKVEQKIIDLGGQIAFPVQISLNNIAAHFCPDADDQTVFKEEDLAKLDVGVHINGYIGDTALSVDLGDNKELVKASEEALDNALKIIKEGVTLAEIGRTIQDSITKYGYSPIKNLSGHGLSQWKIHHKPNIPNFDTKDNTRLEKSMVIAIEPFATNGVGTIFESSNPTLFSLVQKKSVRSNFAREILKEIELYNNLPFTTRWLSKKFGLGKTKLALRELLQAEIIQAHVPLPEKANGLVSQAEHTAIILEKPIITTKIDED